MLRHAPHTLSPEGESILATAETPLSSPSAIQRELVTLNLPAPDVTLSNGTAVPVDYKSLSSASSLPNQSDRRAVYEAYWKNFSKLQGALGATLQGSVRADVFNARARRFNSSLEASLFDLNIPVDVYGTMLAEVGAGVSVLHRYYALRKHVLALPELYPSDLGVPLATIDRKFSLPEIRSLTLKAVQPLGTAYVERLQKATEARWMDAFPRPGKRPGGYSNPGAYGLHPYVLLNINPTYTGATSFAHEWGHAMHASVAQEAQPFDTFNAPPFMQEIASSCNEQLLVKYMIQGSKTKQETLFYLGQQMENFAFVFFRQAMKAEFEADIHQAAERGESLSGEQMTDRYRALMQRYYGPSVSVDTMYATEWGRQPQYYNAFYIFQYVVAMTGAVHFSRSILNGGASERDRYLDMLRAGGSNYGYEVLRAAGLDLASPVPYRNLLAQFAITMDRAEALLA